ncbi:MAG TPA: ATP-binding protein, partial [Treponemataceae bacterium]|nr:ATP-binding protein [Treponemataceae bacterium]
NLDLLCIADTDGHFIRVNREWSNILGYTTEDLESRQFLDFVHPDDLDSTLKTLSLLDEQKDVINFVNRYRCKDGSYRFIEWRSHPQGKRIYAAARDITDRKKNDALLQSYLSMQEILIRMSSRFINIPLEHMDSAINDSLREIGTFIHSDRSYVFEYRWAEQYCINTHEWCNAGTSSQMAKLQHVDVTDVPEWTAAHRSGSAIVISDVQTLDTDSRIRHILLEQEVKSLLTIPMMERDECIGFIGFDWVHTLHEYSEKEKLLLTMFSDMLINFFNRFKLEKNLVEARDLANSANQAKSDFLANMSHEIRTPMNAIIGLTSLVMDSTLTEEQYGLLRKIDISSKLLMEIINNVLDFSKIEAGKMEIDEHPFSFETIIDQLQSLFSESAKEKNIELFLSLDSKIPRFLIGDSLRLYQVLANIVSNAIKFTENGSVTCSITLASAHGSETRVAFTISDTGIGMNRDELAGLFRAFSQADSSTSRKYGGTGLGLVISSRLVSAMGGSISATSQRGKGSTFSFELVFHIPVPSETDADNREIFVPSFTTQETG